MSYSLIAYFASSIPKLNALYHYCLLPILPINLFPVPAILHHASSSAQYQSWMLYYFEEEECGRYFCILLKILLSWPSSLLLLALQTSENPNQVFPANHDHHLVLFKLTFPFLANSPGSTVQLVPWQLLQSLGGQLIRKSNLTWLISVIGEKLKSQEIRKNRCLFQ